MATLPRFGMPDVNFIEHDPATIKQEMVADYEAYTGRTLAAGDPVRQMILWMADKFVQLSAAHNAGDQQTLLSYAQGKHLEAIGSLFQTARLPSAKAVTTIRFTLSEAVANAYTIPKGFLVTNGVVTFETDDELVIAPGKTEGNMTATCTIEGDVGNGYLEGQISTIVNPMTFLASATNISETSGGADAETDEDLADRIRLAPNAFSVAGPERAYIYHAYSVSSSIIDVSVTSPTPGVVHVMPLTEGGNLPSEELLEQIEERLTDDDVRPLTDEVHAIAPTPVEYEIVVDYWINEDDKNRSSAIQKAVLDAVEKYRVWQQTKIGRDILPAQLIHEVIGAGAYRIDATTMSPSDFVELASNQVAQCTGVTVNYKGYKTI